MSYWSTKTFEISERNLTTVLKPKQIRIDVYIRRLRLRLGLRSTVTFTFNGYVYPTTAAAARPGASSLCLCEQKQVVAASCLQKCTSIEPWLSSEMEHLAP